METTELSAENNALILSDNYPEILSDIPAELARVQVKYDLEIKILSRWIVFNIEAAMFG